MSRVFVQQLSRKALAIVLGSIVATDVTAQEPAPQITWPVVQYDPAAMADPPSPADLVLPMPCGGAMSFQRVDVPVERENPLSDRALRIGQADEATAFSDYLRPEFLRGAFGDWQEGQSHYYIARYELTVGQARALRGDCAEISPGDRRAQGELSWFDGVELGRIYTEWLRATAPDQIPRNDQAVGFIRLPTEVEWEFAARGGVRIDASEFPSRVFSGDADLREFAALAAPGSSRGRLIPVGLRQANPLGLFDVYGNAEEMMLEPFRLNAVGRIHGQAGGLVTRGGSYLSTPDQISSAARAELALFSDRTGEALAGPTFGVRFVVSALVTQSDAYLEELSSAWSETANADTAAIDDPNAQLDQLIEEEIDPRRRAALAALQLDFLRARDEADAALLEAAKSTLLSGAIFVSTLEEDAAEIVRFEFNIGNLTDLARVSDTETRANLNRRIAIFVDQIQQLRSAQRGLLLTYRSALETMVDDFSEVERQQALDLLRAELLAGGRDEVLRLLLRFEEDVATYALRPDMTENDVLALAIDG
ncbi:MAG: SUMF1/EgtB/PvdO family nonheme iron enzyme [Pseudomonadota bacterium]